MSPFSSTFTENVGRLEGCESLPTSGRSGKPGHHSPFTAPVLRSKACGEGWGRHLDGSGCNKPRPPLHSHRIVSGADHASVVSQLALQDLSLNGQAQMAAFVGHLWRDF